MAVSTCIDAYLSPRKAFQLFGETSFTRGIALKNGPSRFGPFSISSPTKLVDTTKSYYQRLAFSALDLALPKWENKSCFQ
jgi:hypothetical protein